MKQLQIRIVSFGYGHGYGHGNAPDAHLTLDLRTHFRDPHVSPGALTGPGFSALWGCAVARAVV